MNDRYVGPAAIKKAKPVVGTWLIFVAVITLLLIFSGCTFNHPAIYSLNGVWEYKKGYEEQYLTGTDLTGWTAIEMPASLRSVKELASYTGILTLRRTLPQEIIEYFKSDLIVGFRTGPLAPAAEIYFNRSLIGSMGSLVPYKPGNDIDSVLFCRIRDYIKDVPNYISIKLFVNTDFEYTGLKGPLKIGIYDVVFADYYQFVVLAFIIMTIYVLVGANFIFIWIRRPRELNNLYFGIFLILMSLFLSVNSEARSILYGTDSEFIRKLDQISLMALAPLFLLFLTHFYNGRHTRFSLILTGYFAVLFVMDHFASQRLTTIIFYLWTPGIIVGFLYLFLQTLVRIRQKNPDALIMLICICIVMAGTLFDNFIASGIFQSVMPGKFLYIVVVLGLALLQSNRYVTVFKQLEVLNASLEQEVAQRTRELETALTELKNKNRELEEVAVKDSLTDLFNHKMIFEILNNVYSYAKRFRHPIAVIMIDIDHFKQINDRFGHQTGDRVIRLVADILKSKLRQYDNKFKIDGQQAEKPEAGVIFQDMNFAGRYGGDEFVLLLPHCSKADTMLVAERLFQTINSIMLEDLPDLKVTASFGVCILEDAAVNADMRHLMTLADNALYLSKQQGRNRISCLDYRDLEPVV